MIFRQDAKYGAFLALNRRTKSITLTPGVNLQPYKTNSKIITTTTRLLSLTME